MRFRSQQNNDSSEADPTAAARKVRMYYIIERLLYEARYSVQKPRYWPGARADGGRSKSGRLFKPVWPAIAEALYRKGIEPQQYLAFVFHYAARQCTPRPEWVKSPDSISRYKSERTGWIKSREQLAALRLRSQIHCLQRAQSVSSSCTLALRHQWPLTEFQQHVLADNSIPLSALFRYCTAMHLGLSRVSDFFLTAAAWQYSREPWIYRRVWGSFLPADFDRRAEPISTTIWQRMIDHAAP